MAEPEVEAQPTPCRVLLVDDTDALRALVSRILERDGRYEVVAEARDGIEGIEQAALHTPDVVLLDLAMPRLDGLGALPGIQRAAPDARIVILSALPREGAEAPSFVSGSAGFIEKGLPPRQLVDELTTLLWALDTIRPAVHDDQVASDGPSSDPSPCRQDGGGTASERLATATHAGLTSIGELCASPPEVLVEVKDHNVRVWITGRPANDTHLRRRSERPLVPEALEQLTESSGAALSQSRCSLWFEVPANAS